MEGNVDGGGRRGGIGWANCGGVGVGCVGKRGWWKGVTAFSLATFTLSFITCLHTCAAPLPVPRCPPSPSYRLSYSVHFLVTTFFYGPTLFSFPSTRTCFPFLLHGFYNYLMLFPVTTPTRILFPLLTCSSTPPALLSSFHVFPSTLVLSHLSLLFFIASCFLALFHYPQRFFSVSYASESPLLFYFFLPLFPFGGPVRP